MSGVPLVEELDVIHWPARCRHAVDLRIESLPDGTLVKVPIKIACGSESGPCLAIVAGVHGDEPDGVLALLELWQELPPDFRGRLILLPVANPEAFVAGQRRSPIDGLDLNRKFPGNPNGMPTERLADALRTRVIAHADFLFSIHSWFATGTALPFVEVWASDTPVAERGYQAALAGGFERIRVTEWPEGLLVKIANEDGIPAIEAEIGGSGRSRPEHRQACKAHIRALMQHLGMLEGTPQPHAGARRYRGQHVHCQHGGVLRVHVALGATTTPGHPIATIQDLHGQTIEEIRVPQTALVATLREYASASAGDLICTLFTPQA